MTRQEIELLEECKIQFMHIHDVCKREPFYTTKNLINKLEAAISVTRCSTQLPTEDEILLEANSRQLEGAEPYSFAGGARWALSNVKQIPKTQKED
jgi:hypothetical protein